MRELILVAQDTTYYGLDLYGRVRLAELLRELDQIDGIEWIRVLYLYPIYFTDELIETLADAKKIIPYLDMPLQHINDRTLKRMQRRVRRHEIEELLAKLRKSIPNLTMRTTFIVGFPGETEAEFEELVEFVRNGPIRAVRRFHLFLRAGNAGRQARRTFARRGQAGTAGSADGGATSDRPRLERGPGRQDDRGDRGRPRSGAARAKCKPAATPTPRTSIAWCASRAKGLEAGRHGHGQDHGGGWV